MNKNSKFLNLDFHIWIIFVQSIYGKSPISKGGQLAYSLAPQEPSLLSALRCQIQQDPQVLQVIWMWIYFKNLYTFFLRSDCLSTPNFKESSCNDKMLPETEYSDPSFGRLTFVSATEKTLAMCSPEQCRVSWLLSALLFLYAY